MGSFSLVGVLLTVGLFLMMVGFFLTQVEATNPFTGQETSVFLIIIDWIIP